MNAQEADMTGKEAWKDMDVQVQETRPGVPATCSLSTLRPTESHTSFLISTRTATMHISILPTGRNYTSICYCYTNKNTTINTTLISNKSKKFSYRITINGSWQGPAESQAFAKPSSWQATRGSRREGPAPCRCGCSHRL